MPIEITEFALMPAILRLEQGDCRLSAIDLRGKGKRRIDDDDALTAAAAAAPNPLIEKFALALKCYDRPQLKSLALHNHFLDPIDLPLMFDALRFIPALDSLVLFHHDLGDSGVQLLMQALLGSKETAPLRELYLSHCGITCKGAEAIADALLQSSRSTGGKLSCLRVLSLGSNQIKTEGTLCLARAFAKYPSLHRLVMHGNKGIPDEMKDESKKHIFYKAIVPTGWQRNIPRNTATSATITNPSTVAMTVLSPLILPHVQRRWERDRVLIRPYEELRRNLKHEMYKKDSTFVDSASQLKLMPDIVAYMAREGMCHKQTSLNSHFDYLKGGTNKCHSEGCDDICPACACTGLNDVYELLHRMPHLLCLIRNTAQS